MFYNRKILIPLLLLIISIIVFLIVNSNNNSKLNILDKKLITRNLSIDELNEADNNFLNEIITKNKNQPKQLDSGNIISNYYNQLFQHENYTDNTLGLNFTLGRKPSSKTMIKNFKMKDQLINNIKNEVRNKNKDKLNKAKADYSKYINNLKYFRHENQIAKPDELLEKRYWMISTNGEIYYVPYSEIQNTREIKKLNNSNSEFIDIGTTKKYLWALKKGGTIHRRAMPCEKHSWEDVYGQLNMIDCDERYIIGVNVNYTLYIADGNAPKTIWYNIGQGYLSCTAGNPSYFYVIDTSGNVRRFTRNFNNSKLDTSFILEASSFTDDSLSFKNIAADENYLWMVGSNKNIYSYEMSTGKFNSHKYMGVKQGDKELEIWQVNIDNQKGGLVNYIDASDSTYITIGDGYGWFYKFDKNSKNNNKIDPSDWYHYPPNGQPINSLKMIGDKNDNYQNIGISTKPSYDNYIHNGTDISCQNIGLDFRTDNHIKNYASQLCDNSPDCKGYSLLLDGNDEMGNLTLGEEPKVCFTSDDVKPDNRQSRKIFYRKQV